MKLKVFTKTDCPNCPAAKKLAQMLENKGANVEWFDLDQEEGLSEAVFFDVLSTPALIITDVDDMEIKGWRGKVPDIKLLENDLKI